MQKIFTAETLFEVTNVKNLLEAANISADLRNEYAAGGVGELSFVNAWPELWVSYEDVHSAKRIIGELENATLEADWLCHCGETNGAAFERCWSCGANKPDTDHDEKIRN